MIPFYINIHIYIDVDECATDNGGCMQICINTVGSYECSCEAGYSMKSDGHTCAGNVNLFTHILCFLLVPYYLRHCHKYNAIISSDNSH